MKDLMGLIYTGENDQFLRELTLTRAVAALPVVGRYRVIDFQMSSLVNSGARNVGVITQRNYHSLMDHLGSGKEWDLHGKHDGLFILPPFLTRDNTGVYEGMLDALRSNLSYLRRSRQEYVVVADSHIVVNIDYQEMLRQHIESAADITVMYRPIQGTIDSSVPHMYFGMDSNGMLTEMEVTPDSPSLQYESLAIMIFRREQLINIVTQATAQGRHHIIRDVLQRAINDKTLRVMGYRCPVPAWSLQSVRSYYSFNMDMLNSALRAQLFDPNLPVYTKVRDDMPAYFGPEANVSGSLIANGARVHGTVINSVIFRGVTVARGAVVRNSIVMQDADVGEKAELDHCIIDKNAAIRAGGRLIGPETYPIVISKNVTI